MFFIILLKLPFMVLISFFLNDYFGKKLQRKRKRINEITRF